MSKPKNSLALWAAILAVILTGLILVAILLPDGQSGPTAPQTSVFPTETTLPETSAVTEPTEPPITLESSFTLSATGDILMHMPVVSTGEISNGEYDFSNIFAFFADYAAKADLAVANLETTLAGADYKHANGKVGYQGYPTFNSPDGIASSLKNAGFDLLLTANNHSYDTRGTGLRRTQEILAGLGLANLGSKPTENAPNHLVVEQNGIRLGLVCYTYEDNASADKKAPNGIPMKAEDAPLLNTFDYSNLPLFYDEMADNIAKMQAEGADAVVLFIHWGNEYQRQHNATQTAMAQALCNLGVDVIIGGHPHVVQPVELLTSADGGRKTVCLYSMGNAVSNQRISEMDLKTGHTEDGLLFSVTFQKYSDGTVILTNTQILPTWVDLRRTPTKAYAIIPLDVQVEDWKTQFGLTDATLAKAEKSYDRTMEIVGPGLAQVQAWLETHKAETETALGVKP